MVCQYHAWPCPACGARVTDLARPEALAPEHRVCERCWREAERDAGDAARALDAARQALAHFDAATKGGE